VNSLRRTINIILLPFCWWAQRFGVGEATATKDPRSFRLLYAARNPSTLAGMERLRELQSHPHFLSAAPSMSGRKALATRSARCAVSILQMLQATHHEDVAALDRRATSECPNPHGGDRPKGEVHRSGSAVLPSVSRTASKSLIVFSLLARTCFQAVHPARWKTTYFAQSSPSYTRRSMR
jgi:hypothetical protein